jgi:hypothetical protein
MSSALGTAVAQLQKAIDTYAARLKEVDGNELGEGLIAGREGIDRLEAAFAGGLHRFDRSGEYRADGALSAIAWLRWKCRLSGGAAAERVGIARQLPQLPKTSEAFGKGQLGYQHVAMLARTVENVGAAPVRQHEASLLQAAQCMDPSRFAGVTKEFEHRLDSACVLAEANRAYARRYLHLGEVSNGLVRLDGLLDAEGGAIVRTALNAVTSRDRDDERSAGQRTHDALVDVCKRQLDSGRLPDAGGVRPHLTITTTVGTLVGLKGQPAGQVSWTPGVPAETVRRLACDAALTRIARKDSYARGAENGTRPDDTGNGSRAEMTAEISAASRTIPPATRRALTARDRGCVFEGCGRPPEWTDAHHLRHWVDGGPTTLENLALLCRRHHRMVHEDGWGLTRSKSGGFEAIAPRGQPEVHARSA